jgi:hypothetical protein
MEDSELTYSASVIADALEPLLNHPGKFTDEEINDLRKHIERIRKLIPKSSI